MLLSRCNADGKIADIYRMVTMPLCSYPYFFYPRLYRVTDLVLEECDFGN